MNILPILSNLRSLSTITTRRYKSYQLLVAGGGAGGCSIAAKFASKLGKKNVAVIEPSLMHYYQPMWTLVGAGIKTVDESRKDMSKVLPLGTRWINDSVVAFKPKENEVETANGEQIGYEHLVIALGLQLRYDWIKGLPEALAASSVGSIYSPVHVKKFHKELTSFIGGNAVFTFPSTPVKCPGAAQKIMYLSEQYFSKQNIRDQTNVTFCTSLPVMFGVKKYSDALDKIVKSRGIQVHFKYDLKEVDAQSKRAIFQSLEKPKETLALSYDLLHVTPPACAPAPIRKNEELCDDQGFLEVDKYTLQHVRYGNIFGIGDCTNLPTSKTAAAVAAQSGVLAKNLGDAMEGEELKGRYSGYTSCPIVTSFDKCILAEFDYDGNPLETFPFEQGIERKSMFWLKKNIMPFIYWDMMLNGIWNGPEKLRKVLRMGGG